MGKNAPSAPSFGLASGRVLMAGVAMGAMGAMGATGASVAEIAVCPPGAPARDDDEIVASRPTYLHAGAPGRIVLRRASAPGCDATELAVPAEEILWFGPAPFAPGAPAPARVFLQGTFDGGETVVGETGDAAAPDPAPSLSDSAVARALRPDENLLTLLTPRVFGRGERAHVSRESRGLVLSCEAGTQPAGLLLTSAAPWPADSSLRLVVTASGEGRFGISVSDEAALAAESPVFAGAITPEAGRPATAFAFDLPARARHWKTWEAAKALTVACPPGRARITLHDVRLAPAPDASVLSDGGDPATRAQPEANRPVPRAAWIWSPDAWRHDAARLLEQAGSERLEALFVTVPVDDGTVADAEVLAEFVRAATRADLAVTPVVGDPRDVLPENLPALLARAQAYRAYNLAADPESRLAGLQLDIEPYLLPGFFLDAAHWRARYLAMVDAVHKVTEGVLPLDVVLPVWWGTHPDWGRRLLDGLPRTGLSVTVMNYRTRPEALRAGATPFLDWGARAGVPVRIALETGPLPDETRRVYRRAAADEPASLWLVDGPRAPVWLLAATPVHELAGQGYVFEREQAMPASHLTFGGDRERLEALAADLAEEWRTWSSFAGLAIHGLDAYPLDESPDPEQDGKENGTP